MSTVPTKKPRTLKAWSKRNVPDELWPEIFPYLPVKSLLCFRAVSPTWRAEIDSPAFARLHLTRFLNNSLQSRLLAVRKSAHDSSECVVKCSTTLRTTAKLAVLQTEEGSGVLRTTPAPTRRKGVRNWEVSCSIDGLFVLRNRDRIRELMLWNPSTRTTRILPPPCPTKIRTATFYTDFGIGFDPVVNDYKFVIFASRSNGDSFGAVYSVGTKSWKDTEFQGEGMSTFNWRYEMGSAFRQILCVRGTLFSIATTKLVTRNSLQLVSFELNCERFGSTKLPEVDDGMPQHCCSHSLARMDGGGTLAVFIASISKGCLWALENLGADIESWGWTKLYTFSSSIPDCQSLACHARILCVKKNGVMLLKWPFTVTSYNLETHEEQVVLEKELLAWPYMENLIIL